MFVLAKVDIGVNPFTRLYYAICHASVDFRYVDKATIDRLDSLLFAVSLFLRGNFLLMGKFEVRLMFEWGGACLWGMNEATKEKYGYAEIERVLPLSHETKVKLIELSRLHDTALDWKNPGGPSPWNKEEDERFEAEAQSILKKIQSELGDFYSVWYRPL